ncbi:hypothetical protein [Acanthamoeba polyphaga mimivirus]|uniref:Uncharacterized protein n=1 Tax=Acanthamoeba polyphaga mimivirus TaxID=212035 RepID=A0A2L2DL18_MIMIV|nr:hypothetical protein [Acanthamoeba polyphaga mimivirus]
MTTYIFKIGEHEKLCYKANNLGELKLHMMKYIDEFKSLFFELVRSKNNILLEKYPDIFNDTLFENWSKNKSKIIECFKFIQPVNLIDTLISYNENGKTIDIIVIEPGKIRDVNKIYYVTDEDFELIKKMCDGEKSPRYKSFMTRGFLLMKDKPQTIAEDICYRLYVIHKKQLGPNNRLLYL